MDILLWTCSIALIALGVAGTVLPALPGTLLVLAGAVLGAWIDHFARVGGITITILTVLAVISWVLDFLAGVMGAKKSGASREALAGAAVGTVVGLFMGLIGVFFMPLVGAVVGEFIARRDQWRAVHVGISTWIGTILGMLAKVVIAFMMIGIFVVALVM